MKSTATPTNHSVVRFNQLLLVALTAAAFAPAAALAAGFEPDGVAEILERRSQLRVEAISSLDRLLALDPDSDRAPMLAERRTRLERQEGAYRCSLLGTTAAEVCYRAQVEQHGEDAGIEIAKLGLGECLLDQGDEVEGIEWLKDVAKNHPESPAAATAQIAIGDQYLATDSLYYARVRYESALRTTDSGAERLYALYQLARVQLGLGELGNAASTFSTIVELTEDGDLAMSLEERQEVRAEAMRALRRLQGLAEHDRRA